MKVIFCEDPFRARTVDEVYQSEADAVTALGLKSTLINFESLAINHNPVHAVKRVSSEEQPTLGIYRGWMLTPNQYAELYVALIEKGVQLINEPQAYQHCHYLPEYYSIIEPYTATSVWLPTSGDANIDDIMDLLRPFGSRPVIVKDYVKSQKHYWNEACFIPSATERESVKRVVTRFLELQGDNINQGLVFREYVEFAPLTTHSKSGMPLVNEFRVFVLDGKPLYVVEYWEEGNYEESLPSLEQFSQVMQRVKSRFFTMDIAKRKDGRWMIVELGDAQVAGLPDRADVQQFYQVLSERLFTQSTGNLA